MRVAACVLLFSAVLLSAPPSEAVDRCATGRGKIRESAAIALRPALRRTVPRTTTPVSISTAGEHYTEHFRILWGPDYDRNDPDWVVSDRGIPVWVEEMAQALEAAQETYVALGYPAPYGSGRFYLDVYVGNTGLVVEDREIRISSSYYAYTEIDRQYRVAYFVFNDDFSHHSADEIPVLRATAAHELFHAVQRAMGYPWDAEGPWDGEEFISDARWNREGWWLEATATWMEEIAEPEVDDYVTYVHDFLGDPAESLSSMDGLREYGAAIIPGYLWARYGGAELIQGVFATAYELELEPAIRNQLAIQGAPSWEEVLTDFWTRAADPHPSVWSDAALYRSFSSPRLLRSVGALPATLEPEIQDQPDRFGANLFRVPAAELPAWFGMAWTDMKARWRVGVRAGDGTATEGIDPATANPVTIGEDATGWAYVAVVNVSGAEGRRAYAAEIGDDGVVADGRPGGESPSGTPGGGSGGCFLQTLSSAPDPK